MPIRREGIFHFIASAFLLEFTGKRLPSEIVKRLKEFPSVSKTTHARPRSEEPPGHHHLQATLFQLTAKIIKIDVDKDDKITLGLGIDQNGFSPACTNDKHWEHVDTLESLIAIICR